MEFLTYPTRCFKEVKRKKQVFSIFCKLSVWKQVVSVDLQALVSWSKLLLRLEHYSPLEAKVPQRHNWTCSLTNRIETTELTEASFVLLTL